jgi:hypothetical protein
MRRQEKQRKRAQRQGILTSAALLLDYRPTVVQQDFGGKFTAYRAHELVSNSRACQPGKLAEEWILLVK